MRHVYACPMRWADMDLLGHVNNVAYADYLREARLAAFADAGDSAETGSTDGTAAPILRLELEYRTSLVFRPEPVLIETTSDGDGVLDQEIAALRDDGGRTVYLRGRTVLAPADGPLPEVAPRQGRTTEVPVLVRASDLAPGGAVDEVAMLELFQEARVAFISTIGARHPELPWVVGRSETTYLRPVRRRDRPYAVRSAIGRVGSSSFEVRAEIVDDDAHVLATSRAVMVGFDPVAQRSRELSEHERTHLVPHLTTS
ncbi:acyl-CoA thioesterase [Mumia sp. DW29H23]|uniref:acyl-CoA thioesterase n=1 Tax=Mumia sp. DW29H23 TaxID=3421241 RepID=UPI003D683985